MIDTIALPERSTDPENGSNLNRLELCADVDSSRYDDRNFYQFPFF